MAKTCVTEKTAQRQEWIEQGLLELMKENGFDQITVSELCRHLGLSRRSFYRYFRDLEDVLESALNHVFQRMVIPGNLPEDAEFTRNYEFWLKNRAVLDALHHSGMTDRLYDYIWRYSGPMALENLSAEDQELRQEISMFATAGYMALAISWYQDGFRRSPEEMGRIAKRMLYQPLLKRK